MATYDVMIDIETLATSHDAVVLSIGAVRFSKSKGIRQKKFYVELSEAYQRSRGRKVDPATLAWWSQQTIDPPNGEVHPSDALQKLQEFCRNARDAWFRGPHFDHVILESLAKDYKTELPWKFYQVKDCRTLDIFGRREREGDTPHNALSDAIEQAKDVIHIRKEIEG